MQQHAPVWSELLLLLLQMLDNAEAILKQQLGQPTAVCGMMYNNPSILNLLQRHLACSCVLLLPYDK